MKINLIRLHVRPNELVTLADLDRLDALDSDESVVLVRDKRGRAAVFPAMQAVAFGPVPVGFDGPRTLYASAPESGKHFWTMPLEVDAETTSIQIPFWAYAVDLGLDEVPYREDVDVLGCVAGFFPAGRPFEVRLSKEAVEVRAPGLRTKTYWTIASATRSHA